MILSTFVAYYNKFITMNRIIITALAALLSSAAFAQKNITVSVTNPLATDRTDQPVVISLADYGEVRRAIVTCDGTEIPCQLDDLDQDEVFDELCFLVDLKSKQHKDFSVELFYDECDEPARYPARVYADMLLRNDKVKQKNKHRQGNSRCRYEQRVFVNPLSHRNRSLLPLLLRVFLQVFLQELPQVLPKSWK